MKKNPLLTRPLPRRQISSARESLNSPQAAGMQAPSSTILRGYFPPAAPEKRWQFLRGARTQELPAAPGRIIGTVAGPDRTPAPKSSGDAGVVRPAANPGRATRSKVWQA